jgi:hypothetical protein
MDKMRRDLEREQSRKLASAREELKRNLASHDRDAQRKYGEMLREYGENVKEDAMRIKLEMDAKYRELAAQTERYEREWKERLREMEFEARLHKSEASARERMSGDEAVRSIENAAKIYAAVDSTPHRLFYPNRINAFYGALKDAADLHRMGLHEAAAAISISVRSGVERFGYDVRDKQYEWARSFSVLKARVGAAHLRLGSELLEWVRCANPAETRQIRKFSPEEKRRAEIEMDYWSKGVYSKSRAEIDRLGSLIAHIIKVGPDSYLKRKDAVGTDELVRMLGRVNETEMALDELGDLCETRYEASCIRKQWGDKIIDFFEGEINFEWLPDESGWREADEETASGETFREYVKLAHPEETSAQDTREWLALAFHNRAGSKVFVCLIPEERGQSVINRVLLYVDHAGNDPDFAREIYSHLMESLGVSEEDGVVALVEDISRVSMSLDPSYRSAGLSLEKLLKNH